MDLTGTLIAGSIWKAQARILAYPHTAKKGL